MGLFGSAIQTCQGRGWLLSWVRENGCVRWGLCGVILASCHLWHTHTKAESGLVYREAPEGRAREVFPVQVGQLPPRNARSP